MVGDSPDFDGVIATQCAGLVTTKMLFNITVSTPGDRFCTFEIKYFYYGRPMRDYGYRKIQLASIQQDIIDQYDLETIQHEDWVYIEIQKGIPVLK